MAAPRVTSEGVRILFVGEHERRKGLEFLLEALAILRRSGKDLNLVTVGHGSALAKLRGLALRLGVSDAVEFRGYVTDHDDTQLPPIYSETDIFVLPSLREGFGFVLLEAMASGIPIVASDVSAIPEVIGNSGILVPPRDAKALANALGALIDDPTMRAELGEAGRRRAEAHFTWDRVIPQVVQVYEEAIDIAEKVQ